MAANSVLLGLVEEFVSGQQDSKASETATGVKTGQFTVLELVEALGLSLTSPQAQTRGRGVQLLSTVLQECYASLSETEAEVLVAFYENRLKDHYAITPYVLQGIKALTKCPQFPPGLSVSILKSLFQDVHAQSLMLKERSCVYNILINLMETREEELKGLGADFIAGNIVHQGYELGKFTEELFEVTSCYFPIDFSAPPNDPHGITQEDLILSLRTVLTGTPRFAEYLLPLIIEKVDSDVQSAKLDSLQTLTACTSLYTHKDVAEFLTGLWSSLRREVFQTTSEKVEACSLSALTALTACLSRSVLQSDSEDGLQVFLELVLGDCKHHLCEPDLKLVWPSAKLLQAAASASYRASLKVTAAVVPLLLEQYSTCTQCAQRRTLLEVVLGFVQPAQNSRSADGEESVLSGFQQPLCSVVFSALSESSAGLQVTACRVLTALGQQPGLLLASDAELAADHLTRMVLVEDESQVCSAVMDCACALARLYPDAFASKMIPKLKGEIFSEPMEMEQNYGPGLAPKHSPQATRQRCVAALAVVSSKPSVVQESAPILLEVLSSAHSGSSLFSLEEVVSTCHSLQRIAAQAQDAEETGRFFHDIIIPRLLGLALQAALQGEREGAQRSPLTEEAVLFALVPVMSTACGRLQSQMAALTASRAVSLFLDGDVSFLPENDFPSPLQLLKKQSEAWRQSQLVCLLMACVCSMPRTVEIPQIDRLFEELEELSCTSPHPFSYTSAAKCFAGLVNKRPEGEQLDSVLERTMKRISSELDCASSSFHTQAFTLLLWVAKALLIRYHPLSTVLTDKLFSLLLDSDLADTAAEGFSLLLSDPADVLNRGCHADLRIMYRQRFFTENSAKLFHGFNSADKVRKSGYLKALSHIVNHLPRQVQLAELPALLPLLLEALAFTDRGVQLSTLLCLQPVLMDPPSALNPHVDGLVFQVLELTTSPGMEVRIASLRCMYALARLADHMVLPFRAKVIRALAKALDDKKRLVRKEAVLARSEWFMVGCPGR
ncbi:hypothetical protein SKAU_G00141820 [Synaphobranchus kaupii]|uniref:MMS19 nucleotide excision repair protein n=1 Tax=Synaphobranchus kaupii TaxID=118154 RepID=A0A9Q1FSD9_SYNKA|nr:hypothetical protein SKAU_G00141820 [Synaphobranchus kaupii]